MRNRLEDVTCIAEEIRFGVECGPDDANILCTESTYVDGVLEEPDAVCCRILFHGTTRTDVMIEVVYLKKTGTTDVNIGICKGSSIDSTEALHLIREKFPDAVQISRYNKSLLLRRKAWNQLSGIYDLNRSLNIASFTDADLQNLCNRTCGTREIFDYNAVDSFIASIVGYGDTAEKSIPISPEIRRMLFGKDAALYLRLYNERNINAIEDEQEQVTAIKCLNEYLDLFEESSFCRNYTYDEFELWLDEYRYNLAMDRVRGRKTLNTAKRKAAESL